MEISEPNPDVRHLFEHMIRRLGREPLAMWSVTPETVATIDLLLVESADRACAGLAIEARRLRPCPARGGRQHLPTGG